MSLFRNLIFHPETLRFFLFTLAFVLLAVSFVVRLMRKEYAPVPTQPLRGYRPVPAQPAEAEKDAASAPAESARVAEAPPPVLPAVPAHVEPARHIEPVPAVEPAKAVEIVPPVESLPSPEPLNAAVPAPQAELPSFPSSPVRGSHSKPCKPSPAWLPICCGACSPFSRWRFSAA